jgi:hypothetical protein
MMLCAAGALAFCYARLAKFTKTNDRSVSLNRDLIKKGLRRNSPKVRIGRGFRRPEDTC